MRRAAGILLVTLAGVGALEGAAHVLAPPEVALADVAALEGARVLVAGEVRRPREAPWGATFDLEDGVARLPVLVREAAPPEGVWLRAEGVVVRWRGAAALDATRVELPAAG